MYINKVKLKTQERKVPQMDLDRGAPMEGEVMLAGLTRTYQTGELIRRMTEEHC